jgi:hypothetical protein
MSTTRLECSVWNNSQSGWGLKILGGPSVRLTHFDRNLSPIIVELDGVDVSVNVNKKSFWNRTCGELIRKPFADFFKRHDLATGHHVWLEVVEPKRRLRLKP